VTWLLTGLVAALTGLVAALTAHAAVNARLLRRPAPGAATGERVSVMLPLRDEAARVTPCLESLLQQDGDVEIVVLDDGSADGTSDVVRAVAGDRVRLIAGAGEPPPGWLGKPHACAQLAAHARPASTVLVFLDADVVLAPGAIGACVALLRSAGVDLLSPYPRITGAGRLVQPLLQWTWLTFLPLRAMERSPRPSLAAAGGQLLVVDRAGYERAGGHAAVRGAVLEDVGLARAVKRAGGRIALADASTLATCRMYGTWRELVDGYTKSLWASSGAAFGAVLLLLGYVVPPVLAVAGAVAGTAELVAGGLAAYLLGVAGRVVTARATGGRPWPDALAQPVSALLFGWLVVRSWRRRRTITWRGRAVVS
jgi:Glycosyltransferase like family 2